MGYHHVWLTEAANTKKPSTCSDGMAPMHRDLWASHRPGTEDSVNLYLFQTTTFVCNMWFVRKFIMCIYIYIDIDNEYISMVPYSLFRVLCTCGLMRSSRFQQVLDTWKGFFEYIYDVYINRWCGYIYDFVYIDIYIYICGAWGVNKNGVHINVYLCIWRKWKQNVYIINKVM